MSPTTPVSDLGARLRAARLAQGLGVVDAGQRLKVPVAIIEAMERGQFDRLGAPVYVRGHVAAYARLLGLPAGITAELPGEAIPAAPALVTMRRSSALGLALERNARRALYVLVTAAIAGPIVWVVTHRAPADAPLAVAPLDAGPVADEAGLSRPLAVALPSTPVEAAPAADGAMPAGAASEPAPAPSGARPEPVVASLTPFYGPASEPPLAPAIGAPSPGLVLRFSGESWIEVHGTDGRRIEEALLRAGDERIYAAGEVGHVTLGNAGAVEVLRDGAPVDLAPFRRANANVARFTVSSDGRIGPTGG
jgi:cytoskeleton protein RodZ